MSVIDQKSQACILSIFPSTNNFLIIDILLRKLPAQRKCSASFQEWTIIIADHYRHAGRPDSAIKNLLRDADK
jgi:hypothetical protein